MLFFPFTAFFNGILSALNYIDYVQVHINDTFVKHR